MPPSAENDSRFQLRRARPSDAEDFARFMAHPEVFGGLLQLPYPDAEMWRQRLSDQQGPGKIDLHLVAVHDGHVVGSAGLYPAAPAPRRRHAMGLGISVAVEFQRQGVGGLLMGALCDYADRWLGILRLELTVFADNQRAQALYRRFGFVEEGVHKAYAMRDGEYVDTIAMARLRPAAAPFGPGAA